MTAIIPFAIIVWSHTVFWPDIFSWITDVYRPQGPTLTFSDFTPGQRTGPLEGKTRPIVGSPVYLLFQPRVHSKFIRVEMQVAADQLLDAIKIGYRRAGVGGPEDNVLVSTSYDKIKKRFSAQIPFDEMVSERVDARRIVFEIPNASTSTPVIVDGVRLYYENN